MPPSCPVPELPNDTHEGIEQWLDQLHDRDMSWRQERHDRYRACHNLLSAGICSMIWHEEAIRLYQTSTRVPPVFDLHLLVENLDQAANVLMELGWTLAPLDIARTRTAVTASSNVFLIAPPDLDITYDYNYAEEVGAPAEKMLVLMAAAEWNVNLRAVADAQEGQWGPNKFFPRIDLYVDNVIGKLLAQRDKQSDVAMHLKRMLTMVYEYVAITDYTNFKDFLSPPHVKFHRLFNSALQNPV